MKSKLDSTGITGASFTMIIGLIVFQVIGVTMALPYTIPLIILGGSIFGAISYLAYKNPANNTAIFFRSLAVAFASIVGGFLGGATVGPFLLIFATLIPPNILLVLTILVSAFGLGLLAYTLDKIINALVKCCKPKFNHSPWSFILLSTTFICMILGGSLGISLGLFGWSAGLLGGALVGMLLGLVNHFCNPNPAVAKVLSNLFAISGVLGGVMLGVVINALLPIPILYLGCLLGASCMLVAAFIGNRMGNNIVKHAFEDKPDHKEAQQNYFDLDNSKLRHKLYQGALLIPALFIGYLTGGLVGFHIASFGTNILLFQAYGTAVAGAVFTCTLTAYYGLNSFANRVKSLIVFGRDCVNTQGPAQRAIFSESSREVLTRNGSSIGLKQTEEPGIFNLYSISAKTVITAGKSKADLETRIASPAIVLR